MIKQMNSSNVEVQCNAVGCITNLATHEDNKAKIAKSGALGPLTRLAKSKDMRVQRNATGALLNMTHSGSLTTRICKTLFADRSQMRIDNNSSTRAQYPYLSNSSPHPMSMYNTIVLQPCRTSPSMPAIVRSSLRMNHALSNPSSI